MATPERKFAVRYYFIDPKDGQILVASKALLDAFLTRRRFIPNWAGMRIRMVQVIARVAGDRLHIADIKGSYMHFDGEGHWDRSREAATAMAHFELAYPGDLPDDHHRRRFIQRRVAASRWHVGGHVLAAILDDVEGGKRVKGKAPWRWAPLSEADADFE
ncbi:hypothetical protein [Inquilinus limosus]|uniref:Uncharacterized protein n=1 Tax=Inquilinus limosus TaxID=171674 RepID=A0A211ZQK9_9PROT|nr:hypothetical protein [Inquilinus limosus]OWJ67466.1 hypothetical protein BWR60_09680 [Inquilinus limosus]